MAARSATARWCSSSTDRSSNSRRRRPRSPRRRATTPDHQFRLRDLVRAIDTAKDDARVKVLVLDLDSYGGGYPAAVTEVANAIGRFKAGGKKVLAYATAYTDGSYLLASNASEIWVNPMGGTLFTGPGGNQLYYKGLIDKLGVNVHVYRVGKFKSYVEPYTRVRPVARGEGSARPRCTARSSASGRI